MADREICTITVCLSHDYNRELGFELEDAVKESWSRMVPWFTRRHGIKSGAIDLENGAVRITWRYEQENSDGR